MSMPIEVSKFRCLTPSGLTNIQKKVDVFMCFCDYYCGYM